MDQWRITERWPNQTIPIAFTDDYPEESRATVYQAMDRLNKMTCVRFTNATLTPSAHHVKIDQKSRACYSKVGKVVGQGKAARRGHQLATLHPDCLRQDGKIMHVLLHMLGLPHQENRPDRDEYVVIHQDNLKVGMKRNFRKITGRFAPVTAGLPYDYGSIMHSPASAFANTNGPAMSLRKPYQGKVGQRDWPSPTDIATMNRLYECHDHYLGDDILGAVPYKDFHAGFMSRNVTISEALRDWIDYMKEQEGMTPSPAGETYPITQEQDKEITETTPVQPATVTTPVPTTDTASLPAPVSPEGKTSSADLGKENARLREENERLLQEKSKVEDLLYEEREKNDRLVQTLEELDSVYQENVKLINMYVKRQQEGEERNRRQFNALRQDVVELGRYLVRREERNRQSPKAPQ
ncbi:uncharacterized protein [Panulirus ornatus]|uniref:uncharacterized protein n=1 Tax=Panulirus ornatus TaxID=150431 RepID=UPI003A898475